MLGFGPLGSLPLGGSPESGIIPPIPVIEFDTHDGKPREDYLAERNRAKKQAADDLRESVRRAARRVSGTVDEIPSLPDEPEARDDLARAIRVDLRADGLVAALSDIEAGLAEFQRELARQAEQDEEDELAILLLLA